MQIRIDGAQGTRPSLDRALQTALPKLLDRLVPSDERSMANALQLSPAVVSSIIPGEEETLVRFNGASVFEALRQAGLTYIAVPPRMNIQLELRNSIGLRMPQSEALLAEQLPLLTEHWGIEMDAYAPILVVRWQWLDGGNQVMLSVRGNTRLQEFVETRELFGGDPAQALGGWLQEVLVKARDAYADGRGLGDAIAADMFETVLTLRRPLSLPALVAFELQLAADPRVHSLTPWYLSADTNSYRLRLTGQDDAWMVKWLYQRGWELTQAPGGWDAH